MAELSLQQWFAKATRRKPKDNAKHSVNMLHATLCLHYIQMYDPELHEALRQAAYQELELPKPGVLKYNVPKHAAVVHRVHKNLGRKMKT